MSDHTELEEVLAEMTAEEILNVEDLSLEDARALKVAINDAHVKGEIETREPWNDSFDEEPL